jgi:hypothetical protein
VFLPVSSRSRVYRHRSLRGLCPAPHPPGPLLPRRYRMLTNLSLSTRALSLCGVIAGPERRRDQVCHQASEGRGEGESRKTFVARTGEIVFESNPTNLGAISFNSRKRPETRHWRRCSEGPKETPIVHARIARMADPASAYPGRVIASFTISPVFRGVPELCRKSANAESFSASERQRTSPRLPVAL